MKRVVVAGKCLDGDCECIVLDHLQEIPDDLPPPFHDGCGCFLIEDTSSQAYAWDDMMPPIPLNKVPCNLDAGTEGFFRRTIGSRLWLDSLSDREFVVLRDEIISAFLVYNRDVPESTIEDEEEWIAPKVKAMIDDLVKRWPDSLWGPAHIVIADWNVDDGYIHWCLGLARAALSGNSEDLYNPQEDIEFMDKMDWYHTETVGMLRATVEFLEELLQIPVVER